MYPSLLSCALLMKHSLMSCLLQLVDISTHSSSSDAVMLKLLDASGTHRFIADALDTWGDFLTSHKYLPKLLNVSGTNTSNIETNVSETWNGTLSIGKEKKHQCLREKTGSKMSQYLYANILFVFCVYIFLALTVLTALTSFKQHENKYQY